ncbi:MAG: polysaccharide deacetylase family protein [Gammaproteobacteria bacterium]|nr:polysaccharide deacetylase family protein [Gammaproteobacteria bacterium]
MQPKVKRLLVDFFSCSACSTLARKVFGHGIPIFMLHRMREHGDAIPPEAATSDTHLRRCLTYLVDNHYSFLSLRDLTHALAHQQRLPEKCVVFTMDDGFEDQARIAAPIFAEFNCPATLFLITGMLDQQLWPWDDKVAFAINQTTVASFNIAIGENSYQFTLNTDKDRRTARRKIQDAIKAGPFDQLTTILANLEKATQVEIPALPPPQYKPLTWEEARGYEKQGIEFAPHTISHSILSRLDRDTASREILGSWQRVREELSNPSPVFCYPTGRYCDFGSREVKLIREAGLTGAVSTIPAQVRPELANDYYRFALPRYSLPNSFSDFKLYCSWVEYVRERNLRYWPR